MGAGNRSSVFNQQSRKPFQEVAEIFKKEIQTNPKESDTRTAFKQLKEVEKQKLKNKIRLQQRNEAKQKTIVLFLSLILGILILAAIGFIIRFLFFD